MTNQVLHHALDYAGRGWPVFPCHPGQKTPAAPHGYRDATTDPGQIHTWFARDPWLNLAIATGAPGPDVLDIDQRGEAGDGFPALAQLEAAGLLDSSIATVRTPSGGLHLYFTGSGQRTGHLPACHVDFLARGGYVLAPPSQVNGTPYQHVTALARHGELDWQAAVRVLRPTNEHMPAERPQAERTPAETASAQRASAEHNPSQQRRPTGRAPRPQWQIDRLARWVAAQPESNRNNGLFWAANRALEANQAADLGPLAAAARQTGLTDPEITRTLDSARRTTQARTEPNSRTTLPAPDAPQAASEPHGRQVNPEPDGREAEGSS